jgi:hypothetical protein
MRKGLTTAQIDYLNVGLMAASAAAAFKWPFELFLFVYAVFGPAHYLTEISWLHDRGFFTKRGRDALWLVGAAMMLAAVEFGLARGVPKSSVMTITFLAFTASLVFATVSSWPARAALIGAAVVGLRLFGGGPAFFSVFAIFLPTLIHVSLFTGCFILVGALRGRSVSGFVSLAAFVAAGASFFLFVPDRAAPAVSDYVRDAYGTMQPDGRFAGGFAGLNFHFLTVFGMHDFGAPKESLSDFVAAVNAAIYTSPAALAVMSFMAFAYCYHYLNWFSKTSIIKWHETSRRRMVVVSVLFVASLAVYAYDYRVGLRWLFLLSAAHVFLEFPLNHLTFIHIGKSVGGVFSGARAGAAAAKP